MAKDSLYFSHDYNARNDRKIAALVKKHKSAGYGIFWITCEMMHEEGGHIEYDDITFGAIAKDANEDVNLVKNVINDCISEFRLLVKENDIVVSGRVSRNLEWKQTLSKIRSNANKSRTNVNKSSTNEEQMFNNSGLKKERKKERKEGDFLGVKFSEDGEIVFFADGSSQELGQRQLQRMKDSNYQPHYIKKGEIE